MEQGKTKVAVVLSGCGVYDGTEIHEVVIGLLALARGGAEVVFAAPDRAQAHVVDHRRGEVVAGETRNVLTEAARIARGNIRDLASLSAQDVDAAFFPGGFGAAKNLSNFAFEGANAQVDPEVSRFIRELYASKKPIAAVCIAPTLLALSLGEGRVTIGNEAGPAAAIEARGGEHQNCPITECVVDEGRKLVTAPAYMLEGDILAVAAGIEAAIAHLLRLVRA